MLRNSVGRLRVVGLLEGASFLLLLGVAMPLKYMADMPGMVRVVGTVHGILWLLYVAAMLDARMVRDWTLRRTGVVGLASLLPFGPFILDASLRREQESDIGSREPVDA